MQHADLILRAQANFEGTPDAESFGYLLHEQQVWDWPAWFALERALLLLHQDYPRGVDLPRNLALALYRLHHLCAVKLAHHLAKTPGAGIKNLDHDTALMLLWRADWAFDCAFNGVAYPPPEDGPPNPLLEDPPS